MDSDCLKTTSNLHHTEQPLISLEDATESLKNIIPDLEDMIELAKMNCSEPDGDLLPDQAASIMLYTMTSESRGVPFHKLLDEALRSSDQEQRTPWHLYLQLLHDALSKVKPIEGIIFYVVNEDLSDQYRTVSKFTFSRFIHCTAGLDTDAKFKASGSNTKRTIFSIECNSNRDISQYHCDGTESIILVQPDQQFEVISSLNAGNGLNIIHIKEIKSN